MRGHKQLNDVKIRAIKPGDKPRKYADGDGLFLYAVPNASGLSLLWRLAYRFPKGGKQKLLSIGPYPVVTLAMAREAALEARRALWRGEDPGELKKIAKAEAKAAVAGSTFDDLAGEYLKTPKSANARPKQKIQLEWLRATLAASPTVKGKHMKDLTHADFAAAVATIAADGKIETARKVAQFAGRVCDLAIRRGLIAANPATGLSKDLPNGGRHTPLAAVQTPEEIKAILDKLAGCGGSVGTKYALRIAPYVVLRTSELIGAEWEEIDFERATWTVPGERMKMKDSHVVPLAAPVIEMLRELQELTGRGRFLFPSRQVKDAHVTSAGFRRALRDAGIGAEHTLHGWRSAFSTWANEAGYGADAIERQLAHEERNKVRAAYDRGARMDKRRAIMEAWAKYLDGLKG